MKEVAIALRPGSASAKKAEGAGFKVLPNKEAAEWADILMILAPDEHQAAIWENDIKGNLRPGAALAFAHGLNIHFSLIEPPADIDVIMIAPKGPGHTVRSEYVRGGGVPCLIAIHQDASGNAHDARASLMPPASAAAARASSRPISARNARPICSASRPCCAAALTALVQAGFETLVEAGYAPEMAYFECLHELKLIVDLMYEGGIANMRYSISNTAEYGDIKTGPRIITEETKKEMKRVLADIQSGRFVKDFVLDNRAGQPELKASRISRQAPPDRAGRQRAARDDALDRRQQAGRPDQELRRGRAAPGLNRARRQPLRQPPDIARGIAKPALPVAIDPVAHFAFHRPARRHAARHRRVRILDIEIVGAAGRLAPLAHLAHHDDGVAETQLGIADHAVGRLVHADDLAAQAPHQKVEIGPRPINEEIGKQRGEAGWDVHPFLLQGRFPALDIELRHQHRRRMKKGLDLNDGRTKAGAASIAWKPFPTA